MNHPLTDELIVELIGDRYYDEDDMRTAADWQLERDAEYFAQYLVKHFGVSPKVAELSAECFKEEMRPQQQEDNSLMTDQHQPTEEKMSEHKNRFREYIPSDVDTRGSIIFELEFSETEELINSPFIQKWLSYHPHTTIVKSENTLMIEYDEGFSWRVIGYISNPDDLQVPNWNSKYIVQYANGEIEVLTNESENKVWSTCGNDAVLKDGTRCKTIEYEDWKKSKQELEKNQ